MAGLAGLRCLHRVIGDFLGFTFSICRARDRILIACDNTTLYACIICNRALSAARDSPASTSLIVTSTHVRSGGVRNFNLYNLARLAARPSAAARTQQIPFLLLYHAVILLAILVVCSTRGGGHSFACTTKSADVRERTERISLIAQLALEHESAYPFCMFAYCAGFS